MLERRQVLYRLTEKEVTCSLVQERKATSPEPGISLPNSQESRLSFERLLKPSMSLSFMKVISTDVRPGRVESKLL